MDEIDVRIKELERQLHGTGTAAPLTGGNGPRRDRDKDRRAPRPRWGRLWRRLRLRGLTLLACTLVALFGLFALTTGTATDPALPASTAPAAVSPRPDPRFGIVEAFRAPDFAARLPIGWERLVFWWKSLQPDGPDSWNAFATNHDHQIDAEVAAGRQLAGVLINTPDWAAVNPAQHGNSVPKGLYLPYDDPHNYWGHFVGLIAKHYAGRVNDWIIWNEVNIPSGQYHTWDGTQADYAQLVKVAYLAAKAANPKARIVLAGDPYWYDHGALFRSLLARLGGDPGAKAHHDYFDIVNLHLYSRPLEMAPIVDEYRRDMSRAGISKPIWIAETNAAPYNDYVRSYPRGAFRDSLDDQVSFIVQAFAIDLAIGVDRIEVNRMVDGTDVAAGGEPLGLVRNDGTARPAIAGYRTAATLFAGVTGGSVAYDRRTGVYTVTLRRGGATISVIWDQHPGPATASIPALRPSAHVYDKFGMGRAIRPHSGRYTFALAPATGNTNGSDPADYVIGGSPLILVQSGGSWVSPR